MKTLLALAFSATTLVAAPPVTLVHEPKTFTPGSAFELRFAEPMVADSAVGKSGESPLLLKPALPGTWKWLSTRSGFFTPSEPPRLGSVVEVGLRAGVKTAVGAKLDAAPLGKFAAPAFRLKGWATEEYLNPDDAPSKPVLGLLFSAPVDAKALADRVWFLGPDALKIPATVSANDPSKNGAHFFPPYRSDDRSVLTWSEQFAAARKPVPGDEKAPDGPRPNVVVIAPAQPLPPGDWKLVLAQGLPSTDGYKLPLPVDVKVGKVKAFTVERITPENLINSGTQLTLDFSKRLAAQVKKDGIAKWISVSPEPPELKIALDESLWSEAAAVIRGKFEIGAEYTVTIAAGLPSAEGSTMPEWKKAVSFGPVKPRLYFQDYATHQQRAGTRQFHLLGINTGTFRVTARRVPNDKVAAALVAYRAYDNGENLPEDEYHTRVDEATMPGEVVWTKDFTPAVKTDEKFTIPMSWDEILGPGKTGTIFLTAEQPTKPAPNVKRVGSQSLLQVTDLGVVWKGSADGGFAQVFSLQSGQPLAGANLVLLDEKGGPLGSAATLADGTARLPKADGVVWLAVSNGADQQLVPFGDERRELEFGRFRINVWGDEEDIYDFGGEQGGHVRGTMFSERPVYKPGETVHLKAVLRDFTPGSPHIPAGRKGTLTVKAPDRRVIFSEKMIISATGSIAASVALPGSTVGGFSARFALDSAKPDDADEDEEWTGVRHYFRVEEYEPNAFEVKLAVANKPMLGKPESADLTAKYYMGKPLAKAQLAWSLRASDDRFTPRGFEDFVFTEALNDWRLREKLSGPGDFSDQGRADIAQDGKAPIKVEVPLNTTLPQPRFVRLTAEVTDLNQQTVTERQMFTMHSSDFYLGIRKMPEVVREGDALPIQLTAVRADGSPLPEPVEATIKLTRVNWQTNRVVDADEAENFRSEPQLQLIQQVPLKTLTAIEMKGRWTLADDAPADKTLRVEKPGLYLLTAVAQDAAGRDVITTTTVHVWGKDVLTWNYRNKFQVELVSDKHEYLPGDKATIIVKTPIAGNALITVEREHVRRHFVTKLEGNAPAITIPVEEGDAPNVFVSVVILRGATDSPRKTKMPEYRIGYTQLAVKRPDARLYVDVKATKPSYQPREEVVATVEVRDEKGNPVRNAEVTLWASDEGILSLMGFETPDLLTYFSQRLRLDVTTGITLSHLLSDDEDGRSFENKGYLVGAAKGMKGGDADVRRNFLGTAYWNAALKTDDEGRVSAKFAAPDGLTRYRLMAVVQTLRDQFGKAEGAFEINKPVMIEPATPRFGNVGDAMTVRAVVHNTTAGDGEVKVTVAFDERAKAAETTRTIQLAAKASAAVDFPVEFIEPGEAKWIWTAEFTGADGGKFRDATESKLKVGWPTPVLNEVLSSTLDGDGELLAKADPTLLDGAGIVRVRFANSRIAEISEGVEELLHYPYGCIEQTTSGMLPWIGLKDFRPMLPGMGKTDAQITALVERAVARILSMQRGDGGLGYWPGAHQSEMWASSYGGFGLAYAKRAGFSVPDDALKRIGDYVSKTLRGAAETDDKWELSARAFTCYALAFMGRGEPAYHELLDKKRALLTQEARAFLALAILESNGPKKTADALLRIQDKAVEADYWYGSVARAQGVRLLAWTRLLGKNAAADGIADALLALRERGHWGNTQANVWAAIGFAEYVRKTEANRKAVAANVAFAGQNTAFKLPAAGGWFEKEFAWNGRVPLQLVNPGKARVFTQVKLSARPKTLITQRTDRGYAIERTYQRILDDGTLAPLGEPSVGDRVLISVDITTPAASRYVVIDDPIPATFELVNPEFRTQAMQGDQLARNWWNHRELRADRMLHFTNSWSAGKYQLRYVARVRAAGTATAPPVKVEEMYDPKRFGLGDSVVVKAQ